MTFRQVHGWENEKPTVSADDSPAPEPKLRSDQLCQTYRSHQSYGSYWSFIAGTILLASGMAGRAAQPSIEITTVPAYGTTENVSGVVAGVDVTTHVVALYIYVGGGWWTKPMFANPTVPIAPNGTWTGDITTGANDKYATRIAAFLIPAGVAPPQASGQGTLPSAIYTIALASDIAIRGPQERFISFAGYQWLVKQSDTPVGPGPNYFSGEPGDVWADAEGLHLSVINRDGKWRCTEVILQESFGYGVYLFQTHGRLDILAPWMVAGFFTWDNEAPAPNREIDFEYSRWGDDAATSNTQYVIQPYDTPGNRYRFHIDLTDAAPDLTHVMVWKPDSVWFRTCHGRHSLGDLRQSDLAAEWRYTGADVPDRGAENFRINFWLCQAPPPEAATTTTFVVPWFRFYPLSAAGQDHWVLY